MIKILKSGSWALGGTQVVELTEGEEVSFGAVDDYQIVGAGWAEWAAPKKTEVDAESAPKPRTKAAK